MKFKKWLLNVFDSLIKTLKNTDSLMKLLFALPALIAIATVQLHAKSAALCTTTGATGIPYYFSPFFLFISLLFSIVVLYVGMSFGAKRKVSSFIVLLVFVLVYVGSTVLYLVLTFTDAGIIAMKEQPAMLVQSLILQIICLASCFAGVVFAALKIDPEYYKDRN